MGKILSMIHANGFIIAQLQMIKMTKEQAQQFLASKATADDMAHLTSDVVIAMELIGDGAVSKWQGMMGPASPDQARGEAPRSIRALFGSSNIKNAVYGSETA